MAEKLKTENKDKWVCPLCHTDCDDRFCAMCGISREIARQYDSLMDENTSSDETGDSTGDWPAVSASEQKNSLYRRRIREAERKAKTDDAAQVPDEAEPAAEITPETDPTEPDALRETEEPFDAQTPEAAELSSEPDSPSAQENSESPQIRLVKRTPFAPYRRPPRKDISARKTPAVKPAQDTQKPSIPVEKEPAVPFPEPKNHPQTDENAGFTDIGAELDAITAKLTPRIDIDISELSAFNDADTEGLPPETKSETAEPAAPSIPVFEPAEKPDDSESASADTPETEPADEAFFEDYYEEPTEDRFVQTVELDLDFGGSGAPAESPDEEDISPADDFGDEMPDTDEPALTDEAASEVKPFPADFPPAAKSAMTAKTGKEIPQEQPDPEEFPEKAVYIETGSGAGLWKPAAIISILTSALLLFALVFVYVKYAVLEPRYGTDAVNTSIGLSDIFPEEETAEVTALTDEEPAATEEAATAPETETPQTEPETTAEATAETTAETTTEAETIPGAETVPDETAEPEPETAPEAYDIDDEAANRG